MARIINLAQPTNRVTGHINRSGRIDCETAMRKAAKLQVFSIDPPHNKSRGSFRAEFAKATRERERRRERESRGRELFRFVSFRFTTNRSRKREKYAREFRKVTKHLYERWREKREEFFPFVSMDATLAFRSLAERFDALTVTERGLHSRRTSRNLDSRESGEDLFEPLPMSACVNEAIFIIEK